MRLNSNNSLKHVDPHRKGPMLAKIRAKWQFALKVWKNSYKNQKYAKLLYQIEPAISSMSAHLLGR